MSDIAPKKPPTSQSYLTQQLTRFRLACRAMRTRLEEAEKSIREVETDLVHIEAALDQLEEESSRKPAA